MMPYSSPPISPTTDHATRATPITHTIATAFAAPRRSRITYSEKGTLTQSPYAPQKSYGIAPRVASGVMA